MAKRKVPARWQDCRTDEEKSAYLGAHPVETLIARGEFRPVDVPIGPRPKQDAHLHMRMDHQLVQQLKAVAKRKGLPYQTLVRMWLVERLHKESESEPA